jgi:hypothetical protein
MVIRPTGQTEGLTRKQLLAIREADAIMLRKKWKGENEREEPELEVRGAAVGDDPVPRR